MIVGNNREDGSDSRVIIGEWVVGGCLNREGEGKSEDIVGEEVI